MPSSRAALAGDFSVSDLLREAAERSIQVGYLVERIPTIETQTMSGTLRAEEVQPGLLMSGYDLTYTAEGGLAVEMERSLICAVLLRGESQPMEIEGHPPISHQLNRPQILGFGEPFRCQRGWRAGSGARAFGITLKPHFLERFSGALTSDDLSPLHEFLEPGFHSAMLPWTSSLTGIANSVLDHSYGGQLATLFHESNALRFLVEMTAALRSQRQANSTIGRLQYERALHAREILDRSLVDPPKALALAKTVGVNLTTLQANFKEAFGTTIFGYVRTERLKMGRVLIVEHGLRVAEAGARVGFTNAAAFTAAYRKHFGRPPTTDQRQLSS